MFYVTVKLTSFAPYSYYIIIISVLFIASDQGYAEFTALASICRSLDGRSYGQGIQSVGRS